MHRPLNKLYRFDDKTKTRKGEPELVTLEDIGLRLLRPLETWDYEVTPLNCSTFATTGGDGVHFSFLHLNGKVTEESPVVMTLPMAFDEPNRIVGADLHEFLSLGCVVGYDALEGLVYNSTTGVVPILSSKRGRATKSGGCVWGRAMASEG